MRRYFIILMCVIGMTPVMPVFAQTVTQPTESTPTPYTLPPTPSPISPLLGAVARGRELLTPVAVDFAQIAKHLKPLRSVAAPVAVALAVWDKTTDAVTVVGGTRNQKKFWSDDGTLEIPRVGGTGVQAGYRGADPNVVVVGAVQPNITLVRRGRYSLEYGYNVPYNRALYSIETLSVGSDYLSSLIQDAFDALREKGIRSRAFPEKLLADVIDPNLVKSIAVIEHADSQIYDTDGSEDSLGRFLVQLAVNKDNALGNVVSSAGARGLVQFIPSTYQLMVTRRPDLGLIPTFEDGMADHKNAVTAAVAYLDMDLAAMPAEVRARAETNFGAVAPYLAASYNGGSTRVVRAIRLWGEDWALDHRAEYRKARGTAARQAIARGSLKDETMYYVVKLTRAYTMLQNGFFATPHAPTPLAIH